MDEPFEDAVGPHRQRFLWIDIARTIALLAMVVFHFTRDLEFFRLIPPGTTLTGFWAAFARLTAGSFLFLSGVSIVVAHGREVRLGSWGKRLATIATAAMFVTLVTYAALPDHFIYFGILHALAVAGLFGIALRKAPAWSLLGSVALVVLIDTAFARSLELSQWWAWTGLSRNVPPTVDFIPIVPWLAPYLAGMAFAKAVHPGKLEPNWPDFVQAARLAWPGQHSLTFYLVHQPVLVAMVWLISLVSS